MHFDIEQIRLGHREQIGKEGACSRVVLSLHCSLPLSGWLWHTPRCSNLQFHTREESHRAPYTTSVSFPSLPKIWVWFGFTLQIVFSPLEVHLLPRIVHAGVVRWKPDPPWGKVDKMPEFHWVGAWPHCNLMQSVHKRMLSISGTSLKELESGHGASLRVIRACVCRWELQWSLLKEQVFLISLWTSKSNMLPLDPNELFLAAMCLLVLGGHPMSSLRPPPQNYVPPCSSQPMKFRNLHYVFILTMTWVNFIS